ncbi:TIGR04104 family putative zinc finger protein [Metaplanococcus flavidus]|uniref:TIGR04104 family putative zinc finger protein n=1 Tax=Metaplanococcus flavidus TaxID=569883 RepID=A0ABW3LA72_9BACL
MQKCTECQQPFKWSQFFLSLWLAFQPVKCRNCGTEYNVANTSRLLATLLLLVPVIYIFIFMQELELSEILIPIVSVIAVISVILPFIMKYEKKKIEVDTNNGNR